MARKNALHADLPPGEHPVTGAVRQLYILSCRWKVLFVDGPVYTGDGTAHGICEYNTQTITISGDQNRELQRTTLIHEICHAIDKTHSNNNINDNEQSSQASEVGWYTIFRDPRNDWFFNFIRENYDDR